MISKGAFYLSGLTGHNITIVMRISLLIKIIQSKQSNRKSTKEMGFQLKLLEKAYFIVKMTGLAMVWLASSDFWKAP